MALTKNLTLSSGINLPNAYIKIQSVEIINGIKSTIKIDIFKDKSARDDNKTPVASFSHVCTNNYYDYYHIDILNQENVNVIAQSYEFIKTLSFYLSATDVSDVKE